MQQPSQAVEWDVAIIGGALSGAATALLLKLENPDLRVVVIEKNTAFKRRVGEATVEVSAYFLCRKLGLTRFLNQTQLTKNGLRFWFSNEHCKNLEDCSEVGGQYLSTVPSFLVDRSVLDEEVLRRAVEEGVELLRPAQVTSVTLVAGGQQQLELRVDGEQRSLNARWVVDASGVRCQLARANGWWRSHQEHPTLSGWSRWRVTRDWDALPFSGSKSEMGRGFVGIRGTATNHFVGDGWWAWWIALKGGDTSIGIVLDPQRASWPSEEASVGEKIWKVLREHAAAREMLQGAEFLEGDVHFRRNLAYYSTVQAGDGFVLVGDAAAFLDPFYSPGMDWVAFSASSAAQIIGTWHREGKCAEEIERHNRDFLISYRRMYEALYKDKYDYLGDFELMRLSFRLDVALYYIFVAGEVFRSGMLAQPPYSHQHAGPIFRLMRLYNTRFAAIARSRRARSCFGRQNHRRRDLFPGFNFRLGLLFKHVALALFGWLLLELKEGWRR